MVVPEVSRADTGSWVERVVANHPSKTTKPRRHKKGIKTKQKNGETTAVPTTISINDNRPDIT